MSLLPPEAVSLSQHLKLKTSTLGNLSTLRRCVRSVWVCGQPGTALRDTKHPVDPNKQQNIPAAPSNTALVGNSITPVGICGSKEEIPLVTSV